MENQEKEVVRPLHELYELLLERYEAYEVGICIQINLLWVKGLISADELNLMEEHFNFQKPTPNHHEEFYYLPTSTPERAYWWKRQATQQRKLFIRKMIEITKPQGNL